MTSRFRVIVIRLHHIQFMYMNSMSTHVMYLYNVVIFLRPAVSIIKLTVCHTNHSTTDSHWLCMRWTLGWRNTWPGQRWRWRQIVLWPRVPQCTFWLFARHSVDVHVYTLYYFNIDEVRGLHTAQTHTYICISPFTDSLTLIVSDS